MLVDRFLLIGKLLKAHRLHVFNDQAVQAAPEIHGGAFALPLAIAFFLQAVDDHQLMLEGFVDLVYIDLVRIHGKPVTAHPAVGVHDEPGGFQG